MAATRALMTCAAVVLSLIHVAAAADYVVGSPDGGWDGRTNYKSWAEAQTFAPGDTLTFKYNSYHSVLEVTKHSFDECITSNPITYDTSGTTTVLLTMPGKRYFICGAPGHCLNGMKMVIEVADRPAPTTPSPPPPLPPPPPPQPAAPAPTTPMPLTPAPMSSWEPAPAPAAVVAAPPTRDAHKKKHKKKSGYCPPDTAPARAPTTQSVQADFPEAMFAPMSSPPPPPATSGASPTVLLHGQITVALAALGGFMMLVAQ